MLPRAECTEENSVRVVTAGPSNLQSLVSELTVSILYLLFFLLVDLIGSAGKGNDACCCWAPILRCTAFSHRKRHWKWDKTLARCLIPGSLPALSTAFSDYVWRAGLSVIGSPAASIRDSIWQHNKAKLFSNQDMGTRTKLSLMY